MLGDFCNDVTKKRQHQSPDAYRFSPIMLNLLFQQLRD